MTLQTRVSLADFERFIWLPENVEQNYEFIGGEIVLVPGHYFASYIGANFIAPLGNYIFPKNMGFLTGANGGFKVIGDEHYIPQIGYVSKQRQFEVPDVAYNPIPPDLVVEVVSELDNPRQIMFKVGNYLAAQTVVWLTYPREQEVIVFIAGKPPKRFGINDMLDGGSVLPGFTLALKDIFSKK